MSARVNLFLALALPVTVAAAVACSSAAPPAPIDHSKGGDDDDNGGTAAANQNLSSAPAAQPVAAAPPKPAVSAAPVQPLDAGAPDASLTTPLQPPAPTTHFCMQLSQCCGRLDSTNALACGATAVAGDETACGVELAVCQGGGIDFGGIGGFLGGLFGSGDDDSF